MKVSDLRESKEQRLVKKIQGVLTPELLKPQFRACWNPSNPMAGHCYAATEALYHLLGGPQSGWKPVRGKDPQGVTHWWLQRGEERLDPTGEQYEEPPYAAGHPGGFLTREPSKRARIIMQRVTEAVSPRRQQDMMVEFSCGSCMYLAYVLNKKFGLPIGGFVGDSDDDGTLDDTVHVWAELPDGRVADIYGVHDWDEFYAKWNDVAEDQGFFEYESNLDPDWVLSLAKQGKWTPQRQRIHQQTLKNAYRAVVDILQKEIEDEQPSRSKYEPQTALDYMIDDTGGLGTAPTSQRTQGIDSHGYGPNYVSDLIDLGPEWSD